jgi:hypothetical protein
VTSFVVTIGFLLFQNVRAVVPSYQVLHALLGFADPVKVIQVKTVISSVSNLANNWLGPSDGLIRSSQPFFYVVNAAYLVVIGVALVRGWRSGSQPGPSVLMTTWALTTLAFSVAWPLLLFVQGHFDFDAPPRYGLLVLPLGATAAVWALARGIPEPADL